MTEFFVQSKTIREFPPINITPPSSNDNIQPQENEGCGRHALNNLFRNPNTSSQDDALFVKGIKNDKIDLYKERPKTGISLFGICSLIHPEGANNNECKDKEDYDISVLTVALQYAGYTVVYYNTSKNDNIMNQYIGGIVNYDRCR